MDELKINTKLFSFEGVIGRRDYFLNLVYIAFINILALVPLSLKLSFSAKSMDDLLNINRVFNSFGFLFKFYILAITLAAALLTISNAIRRTNDITGETNNIINGVVATILTLCAFYIFFPFKIILILALAHLILNLILIFKKGKITSKLPYDPAKIFNWGAYFGTWIWGAYNKSFITFLYIPLFLTPWGELFRLVCGLKGNEWAYKNKEWNDVEKFNESQTRQTVFWAVISFIVVPVVLFFTLIMFCIGVSLSDSPKSADKADNGSKIEKIISGFANIYFESYEITDNENKFYVTDSNWNQTSYSDKMEMMRFASKFSAMKKRSEMNRKNPDKYTYISEYSQLPITKIYSHDSGKLLGEFVDKVDYNSGNVVEMVKGTMDSFKFYKTN